MTQSNSEQFVSNSEQFVSDSELFVSNRSRLLSAPLYKALNLNCGPFVKQISTCRLSKVISDLNAVFRNNPSVII